MGHTDFELLFSVLQISVHNLYYNYRGYDFFSPFHLKREAFTFLSQSLHSFVCSVAEVEEAYGGMCMLAALFHVLSRFCGLLWTTVSSGEMSQPRGVFRL